LILLALIRDVRAGRVLVRGVLALGARPRRVPDCGVLRCRILSYFARGRASLTGRLAAAGRRRSRVLGLPRMLRNLPRLTCRDGVIRGGIILRRSAVGSDRTAGPPVSRTHAPT